jgi:N-acyl-D-aspartate/D-glutamate deacylase
VSATVLRGGTVIDGTGAPARPADVLIEGDRIAAVLEPGAPAEATSMDVAGKLVCPGFIDVHTHDDLAVVRDPGLLAKLRQGVTTVIVGNCGLAAAPIGVGHPWHDGVGAAIMGPEPERADWRTVAEYLEAVEAVEPSVNVALLAGHNALRLAAVGTGEVELTAAELSRLLDEAAGAMEAGALGVSTGLIYPPGRAATTGELVELARAVAAEGGMYVTHLRDESDRLDEAVEEALEVGAAADCPVHISHLKAAGRGNWGRLERIVSRLREAGATTDVYPYTAAATALMPALRAAGAGPPVASDYMISAAPGATELEGLRLDELARRWELEPLEAAARIDALTGGRTSVVYFVISEEDLERALAFERTMIGSDGLPVRDGRPHPRLYGSFPRVLTRYVRDRGVLGLEEAVRRMTGLPAAVFGLGGRGVVHAGCAADLVVLDLGRLDDRATYQEPAVHPRGIENVIVNGTVAWDTSRERVVDEDGAASEGRGRVLRRQEAPTWP